MWRWIQPETCISPILSMIELLVVIAVIAVIAAILFPVFARVREKARQTTCLSNEKQIAAAVQIYMQDYDEMFPFVLNWSGNILQDGNWGDGFKHPQLQGYSGTEPQFQLVTVAAPYIKNAGIWYCPSVGPDYVWQAMVQFSNWKKGATMRDQGTSYSYTYLSIDRALKRATFMGGKSAAILLEPGRWPMLFDEPDGAGFTGSITDPPLSAVPHSGGLNVGYGDGHAKFHRMETADGSTYPAAHAGDGLYPDQ
jgi:prepilin-type processing-associated H-X9-DG protein